jgi:hypothetical protein
MERFGGGSSQRVQSLNERRSPWSRIDSRGVSLRGPIGYEAQRVAADGSTRATLVARWHAASRRGPDGDGPRQLRPVSR